MNELFYFQYKIRGIKRRGGAFLDVGANTGTWTIHLATQFEKVIAVEPNSDNWSELKKVVPSNTVILNCAAWNIPEVVEFHGFDNPDHFSAIPSIGVRGRSEQRETRLVYACPLDSLVYSNPIDFIKIDVEGAEEHALLGLYFTLRDYKPELCIEIHSKESGDQVLEWLESFGYKLEIFRHPDLAHDPEASAQHYWIWASYEQEKLSN